LRRGGRPERAMRLLVDAFACAHGGMQPTGYANLMARAHLARLRPLKEVGRALRAWRQRAAQLERAMHKAVLHLIGIDMGTTDEAAVQLFARQPNDCGQCPSPSEAPAGSPCVHAASSVV